MKNIIDIEKIISMMPHRYPFLLIDRLIDIKNDEYAVGLKNVTINEPFFTGHFPGKKVMPGVLIVESMAQTSGALVVSSFGKEAMGKLVYFMSIDKARFKKPVIPGDQLKLKVEMKKSRQGFAVFDALATVEGEVAASAELMCGFKELPKKL